MKYKCDILVFLFIESLEMRITFNANNIKGQFLLNNYTID